MVLALLIVPMAFARLISRRLYVLVPLAIAAPLLSAVLALWMSFDWSMNFNVSPSPGALLVITLLGFYALALASYGLRSLSHSRPHRKRVLA